MDGALGSRTSSEEVGDKGRDSVAALTTASGKSTTGEDSRRTEDEAVTLPIPSSGLLTSPTQKHGHHGGYNSPSTAAWYSCVSPTAESHFSLAPLLGRANGSPAIGRNRSIYTASSDGAVVQHDGPAPWPAPPHAPREFGHAPSLVCSSGDAADGPSAGVPRQRTSCGNLTLSKMAPVPPAGTDDDTKPTGSGLTSGKPVSHDLIGAGSDFQGHLLPPPYEAQLGPAAPASSRENPLDALDTQSAREHCGHYEEVKARDTARASSIHLSNAVIDREWHSAVAPEDDGTASRFLGQGRGGDGEGDGQGEGEESCGGTDAGLSVSGQDAEPGEEEEDGGRWFTAEECAVSDAITQLQAVVSGLSEPYQRYIRERALELTRIIDENLQRQGGLEPAGQGFGSGCMTTPSNKAATAAAALVLAVAASGTRWPCSTPGGADGGVAGMVDGMGLGGIDETGGTGMGGFTGGARWLFRTPAGTGLASVNSMASSLPRSQQGGVDEVVAGLSMEPSGMALSYALAASGSCNICFGSVLGNSQARPTDSGNLTSGAVSARATSQNALSSNRPTPRSRSYSSFYAHQQSLRRLRNHPVDAMSAISSACSNRTAQLQPSSDPPMRPSAGARRVPPRPPPRGLGCGLGLSIKRQVYSTGSHPDVDLAPLEQTTSTNLARDGGLLPCGPTRGSRVSGTQPECQALADPVQQYGYYHMEPFQQAVAAVAQRRVMGGRPATGTNAMAGRGVGAGGAGAGGSYAKLAPAGRGAARPPPAGAPGFQAQWQRLHPGGRGIAAALEKQRSDIADLEQRVGRRMPGQVTSAREQPPGGPVQPAPGGGLTKRNQRRTPSTHPSMGGDEDGGAESAAARSARNAAVQDAIVREARSSYQQLLWRSASGQTSLTSLRRTAGGGTGVPGHSHHSARGDVYSASGFSTELAVAAPPRPATDREYIPGAATVAAASGFARPSGPRSGGGVDLVSDVPWDGASLRADDVPYHMLNAYHPTNREGASRLLDVQPTDWQPLHTALKLDELLAHSYNTDSDAIPAVPIPLPDGGPTPREVAMRANAAMHRASGNLRGSVHPNDLLAMTGDEDDEPATAFVIVSRRSTRDVDDHGPAMSSILDLSSLLPAPAWRQVRAATEPAAGGTAPAGITTSTAATGARTVAAESTASTSSGCSTQVWNKGAAAVTVAAVGNVRGRPRLLASTAAAAGAQQPGGSAVGTASGAEAERSGGGAAAAGAPQPLRHISNSGGGALQGVAAGGASQGRRWQLDADCLVIPDREQIRAGSPVKLRYARNSDSHTSPTAERKPQQPRRRAPSVQREASVSTKATRGGRGATAAGVATRKSTGAKRPGASLGATGRSTGAGGRSRSTPHGRASKTIRTGTRAVGTNRPPLPQAQQAQAAPVVAATQAPRPSTPVAPSSPPPPLQSQTPVQLQQQLQQQQAAGAAAGARRWAADDTVDCIHGRGDSPCGSPATPTRRRPLVHSPKDMPLSAAARQSLQPRLAMADAAAAATTAHGTATADVALSTATPIGTGATAAMPGMGMVPSRALPPGGGRSSGGGTAPIWDDLGSPPRPTAPPRMPGPKPPTPGRVRGISYAPLPSNRWTGGAARAYPATSAHTDCSGASTTMASPSQHRSGAWHHDCTPNILSPPRNYDRPWATPSGKSQADGQQPQQQMLQSQQQQPGPGSEAMMEGMPYSGVTATRLPMRGPAGEDLCQMSPTTARRSGAAPMRPAVGMYGQEAQQGMPPQGMPGQGSGGRWQHGEGMPVHGQGSGGRWQHGEGMLAYGQGSGGRWHGEGPPAHGQGSGGRWQHGEGMPAYGQGSGGRWHGEGPPAHGYGSGGRWQHGEGMPTYGQSSGGRWHGEGPPAHGHGSGGRWQHGEGMPAHGQGSGGRWQHGEGMPPHGQSSGGRWHGEGPPVHGHGSGGRWQHGERIPPQSTVDPPGPAASYQAGGPPLMIAPGAVTFSIPDSARTLERSDMHGVRIGGGSVGAMINTSHHMTTAAINASGAHAAALASLKEAAQESSFLGAVAAIADANRAASGYTGLMLARLQHQSLKPSLPQTSSFMGGGGSASGGAFAVAMAAAAAAAAAGQSGLAASAGGAQSIGTPAPALATSTAILSGKELAAGTLTAAASELKPDAAPRPDQMENLPTQAGTVSARRTSSEGSKSMGHDSFRSQLMATGRSGRPPPGAFRPACSLRAAPAGSGGAQLALLQQAAWPGLREPRVVDALCTLEAGIAVLDPVPPPPPSTVAASEASESCAASATAPNGCFGLFNRTSASVAKAPVVPAPTELVGQRPVLLRVQVADGAVELVFLRPRRGGSIAAAPPPTALAAPQAQPATAPSSGGGAAGTAATAAAAGEQRVRVAALSGVYPPLNLVSTAGANASANAEDDVADPASRWVQLVAMDGGLMRLSACSPADHARLVLGLNAGLLAALGAIGEEAPLAVVPLCRGLGGAP